MSQQRVGVRRAYDSYRRSHYWILRFGTDDVLMFPTERSANAAARRIRASGSRQAAIAEIRKISREGRDYRWNPKWKAKRRRSKSRRNPRKRNGSTTQFLGRVVSRARDGSALAVQTQRDQVGRSKADGSYGWRETTKTVSIDTVPKWLRSKVQRLHRGDLVAGSVARYGRRGSLRQIHKVGSAGKAQRMNRKR